jgi:hypothetical protein
VSSVSERSKVVDLGSLGTFKLPLASSNINESDALVRVQNGNIVAIGGLMKQGSPTPGRVCPARPRAPPAGCSTAAAATSPSTSWAIPIKPTVIQVAGRPGRRAPRETSMKTSPDHRNKMERDMTAKTSRPRRGRPTGASRFGAPQARRQGAAAASPGCCAAGRDRAAFGVSGAAPADGRRGGRCRHRQEPFGRRDPGRISPARACPHRA